MKVLNFMTKKPVTLKEKYTVLSAVKEIEEHDCSFLPVVDDNHNIQGIVTNRDIIVKAIAKDKDLSKMPITDIMSKNVICCEEEDSLQQAISQMSRHNIRRILVKNNTGELSGILSIIDVINKVKDSALLVELLKVFSSKNI
jgi:CBS domain-containing protein